MLISSSVQVQYSTLNLHSITNSCFNVSLESLGVIKQFNFIKLFRTYNYVYIYSCICVQQLGCLDIVCLN